MLLKHHIETKVVDVVDNNSIDKEVTLYKPNYVIIEALWVVPEKFKILIQLHPTVTWIIRIHSEIPFISSEGNAFGWLSDYSKYSNVKIACNSNRILKDLEFLLKKEVIYLPNVYNLEHLRKPSRKLHDNKVLNIGCFGAIRPLKNQLIQAIAAIKFASTVNKKLRFHINASRVEGNGGSILKNIRALFADNLYGHELIEHDWMEHIEFVNLISTMDIVMQVSFSETYNIVAADAVSHSVPVVASKEISFISSLFTASCTDIKDIETKLCFAYYLRSFSFINYLLLKLSCYEATKQWLRVFK